jgi:hypothetical protein
MPERALSKLREIIPEDQPVKGPHVVPDSAEKL